MPALLTNVQTDLVLDLSTMTNPAAKRWQIHVQPGNVCCADLSLNSAGIALRGRWNVATRLHVLHPVTSFNASAFVRVPDYGTFDVRGCLVDRETRESLVLSPLLPPSSHLHYTTGTQTWQLSFHYNCTQQFEENALKSDSRDCCQIRQDPAAIRDF